MGSRIYNRNRFLWGWLTLLCMAIIFFNSALSGDLSNNISNGIADKIQGSNQGNNDLSSSENNGITPSKENNKNNVSKSHGTFNIILRKSAHFFQFFILSILSIKFLLSFEIDRKRVFVLSIVFIFLYACFDEAHQLFIDGRSGRVLDVFIDSAGGIIGGMISMFFTRKTLN